MLDGVPQLADVARVGVAEQQLQGSGGEDTRLAVPANGFCEEEPRQRFDEIDVDQLAAGAGGSMSSGRFRSGGTTRVTTESR